MYRITIEIEDDEQGQNFLDDKEEYPDHPLFTPCQENQVDFKIVQVIVVK